MLKDPVQCAKCKVWTSNEDHICVEYDGPPCAVCGAPTVFVSAAAPGVGTARVCKNRHQTESTIRVLTPAEVI